jgi:pimeloyl-ACP methyl ester carboxylesterase
MAAAAQAAAVKPGGSARGGSPGPRSSRAEPAHVLLLHGQPGTARDWDGVVAALPAGVGAVAIDRPGWNGAGRAGDLAHNAAAAIAALDRAGAERATVVGHSFGGAVAAWLAARHPERVAALVLVAPAASRAALSPVDRLLAAPVAGYALGTSLMAVSGAALAAPPARHAIGAHLRLDDAFVQRAGQMLRSPRSWHAFAAEQRALLRALCELEAALGSIAAPTTIVIGTEDRIVSPASARELARGLPSARLVGIAGAGHLLPFQQPARLAELITTPAP